MSKSIGCSSESLFSLEELEQRRLLSVSLDAGGWTSVTPSPDTRRIFVSSSTGNDANSGLLPTTPVKTIDYAKSLLRDGMPDWLLLKRGDSWSGEGLGSWSKSGRSEQEPMLISAYGVGARPLLKTGAYHGFYTQNGAVNNLDLIGIHFYADTRDPNSPTYVGPDGGIGIRLLSGSTNVLIEDCMVDSYMTNISISNDLGPISNVTLRRSIITDAYVTTGHSQGALFGGIDGLTIEGNVFDHNGWNEQIPGAVPTKFNHNIYVVSNNKNVVVKDNIIANASSHGLTARSGGKISGNIFINNAIGMSFGFNNGSEETPGGASGFIKDNIFYGSGDIGGSGGGYVMEIGNIKPGGTTISGNIMIGDAKSLSPAIQLSEGKTGSLPSGTIGINDLTIENNVLYNWASALWVDSRMIPGSTGPYALNNFTVRNNDFQRTFNKQMIVLGGLFDPLQEHFSANRYSPTQSESYPFAVNVEPLTFSAWQDIVEPTAVVDEMNYYDPTRSIESYNGAISGEATMEGFLREARQQSRGNWRPEYMAPVIGSYFRQGFHLLGDLNLDGSVSIADFITLASNFGQSNQDWTTGDLNGDGTVTVADMIDLALNFGTISPAQLNQVATFAEAVTLTNESTLSQDDPNQSTTTSDATNFASIWETSALPESNDAGEENLSSRVLTESASKRIIRPVWFTYPRR